MTEIAQSAAEAVAGIEDGSTVLIGGFGNAGQPMELIDALPKGEPPREPGKILKAKAE